VILMMRLTLKSLCCELVKYNSKNDLDSGGFELYAGLKGWVSLFFAFFGSGPLLLSGHAHNVLNFVGEFGLLSFAVFDVGELDVGLDWLVFLETSTAHLLGVIIMTVSMNNTWFQIIPNTHKSTKQN